MATEEEEDKPLHLFLLAVSTLLDGSRRIAAEVHAGEVDVRV
jgi:hypothetical protein